MNRATKRPIRPSSFVGLPEAGWSPAACVDFDYMIERFDVWLEQRAEETVEKDRPRKPSDKVRVPKYTTLRDLLAIREDHAHDELTPEVEAAAAAFLSGELDLFDLPGLDDILNAPLGGGAAIEGASGPDFP